MPCKQRRRKRGTFFCALIFFHLLWEIPLHCFCSVRFWRIKFCLGWRCASLSKLVYNKFRNPDCKPRTATDRAPFCDYLRNVFIVNVEVWLCCIPVFFRPALTVVQGQVTDAVWTEGSVPRVGWCLYCHYLGVRLHFPHHPFRAAYVISLQYQLSFHTCSARPVVSP